MRLAAGAGTPAGRRLGEGLRLWLGVSLYLWLCLGAMLLYSEALLADQGARHGALPYGLAAAKALVLGKFILLGHEMRLGERMGPRPLVLRVLLRSGLFLLLLVLLSAAEELVIGLLHHQGLAEAIRARTEGRWPELGARVLLVWLFLLPYLAFRALQEALGREEMRRIVFGAARDRVT